MKKKFGGEFNIGEAEKAREEELRKAGALRGGEPEEQQLLSEHEATAYQQYATQKEGIPFSEKASDYEEAEGLIKKLRDADINLEFLNIDWDKINFHDAYAIGDLKARLDAAARQFLDQMQDSEEIDNEETKGFFDKVKEFLKNNKAAVLPLALSAGLLIGCSKEGVNSGKKIIGKVIGESGKVIETVVKDSGVETSYGEDSAKILKEWKDKHPEVKKIVLSSLFSNEDRVADPHKTAAAEIIIFTENETFLCRGDIESQGSHLESKNSAIKKALENYELKISAKSKQGKTDTKDSSNIGVVKVAERNQSVDSAKEMGRDPSIESSSNDPKIYKLLKSIKDGNAMISKIKLDVNSVADTKGEKDDYGERDIKRRAINTKVTLKIVLKDGTELSGSGFDEIKAVDTPNFDKVVGLVDKAINKVGIDYKSDETHKFGGSEWLVKHDSESRAIHRAVRELNLNQYAHYSNMLKKPLSDKHKKHE